MTNYLQLTLINILIYLSRMAILTVHNCTITLWSSLDNLEVT